MTFVDHAEFIWNETGTQQQIADVMGWSRGKVSQYAMLKTLKEYVLEVDNEKTIVDNPAWELIATTFENNEMV